ncbi:MAG: PKD domain-containing protein, partial [Methanoregula sp.]|nr:PKD domain-containing protein [Methanoregula sp.]
MTELPKRVTSYKTNIWKESAHSSVIGVLMLITIVMIMGGVVALMFATQSMPDKVPMAYLGIAKYNDGVELVNKAGDTLTNSSVKILVDGIDRTAEFKAQENTPGWGTLKPGERLYYKSPVEPESVQIVYTSTSGQYLLASSESTINTPIQVGISSTASTSAIQYQSLQETDAASAPKAQFTSNTTQGGSPLAVQFNDQSTGTAPMTYHWDFSDGAGNLPENSMKNPVWRFWDNVATSYTVTLTVTNAYGSDTITKTNYITLGDTSSRITPVAAFTSGVQNGTAPLTVKFYDQSVSTGVTSYAWNIDNDSTIDYTIRNPSHTFTTAGNYTVKLIVTNASGSDSEIKSDYIRVTSSGIAPKAQFTSNTTQGGSPLAVQFNDQSTGTAPMTYHWDFSDGAGSLAENSMKNPVWRFWDNVATSYTVTLTVTNAYGSDTITKTNYITLGDTQQATVIPTPTTAPSKLPTAQFSAGPTSGQAPLAVQFTDTSVSTGTTSYKWDVNNDGTTDYTTKSPSHIYTTAGTYSVKLTVTNASGSDSEIKTGYITATSTPVVEVTPVSNGAYGAGTSYGGYTIGGGAGYPTYSAATATYVVTTLAQFKSHMVGGSQPAKAGEIVFIPSGTTINFNGNSVVTIPAGVIIASDRGYNGNTGAILKKSLSSGGWTD